MSIDVTFGFIHPATVGNPLSERRSVNDDEPTPLEKWSELSRKSSKLFE
jgi:hypothetical protein